MNDSLKFSTISNLFGGVLKHVSTFRKQLKTGFPVKLALILMIQFATTAVAQDPIDFSRDIQPILSENCYFCHGPDSNRREADLRLDDEEAASEVIEAGNPDLSELFSRICSDDPDLLMPPPESNRRLSTEQIGKVREWIRQGANWKQHWAFSPILKKDLPKQKAIDWFVDRKLSANQLRRSEAASKSVLIRRVSLDLTGLPPTPQEIEDYLADDSESAYETMVDYYLASEHFGERMAWDWLDAARYADSNGYQGDNERTMWPWRDWVVRAFNQNMPFDDFSIWQLAGDRLPNATPEQILATGFNRNHPINGEGGRIPEENRVDYVMDMAETTGTVWLGLTLNCCRCHDHKYDRLTQDDYYRFFAFFNQTPVNGGGGNAQTEPTIAVPSPSQSVRQDKLKRELEIADAELKQRIQELMPQQDEWESKTIDLVPSSNPWTVFQPESFLADSSKLRKLDDDSLLAFGANPDRNIYRIRGEMNLSKITAVKLEALTHESMTKKGLSRSSSSNFVLTNFELWYRDDEQKEFQQKRFSSAEASFSQNNHHVSKAIDKDWQSGWAVWDGTPATQPQEAVFILEQPLDSRAGSEIEVVLKHQSNHKKHTLGRFRISFTDESSPPTVGEFSEAFLSALRTDPDQRDESQQELLQDAFLRSDSKYFELNKAASSLRDRLKKVTDEIPKVMVMADRDQYRKTFRLERGSYQSPANEIVAGTPDWLPALPADAEADRLALANWLFANDNPLTARVIANRYWAKFMGVGIVKTTEDFGVQGEPPSHPELLDWLAAEFRDSGWDTKHLLRLILCSQTYRQSSKTNKYLLETDPENRLFARASRFRLPSWMLRDQALAASELLVRKLGGQPVNSYQPKGVWEEASFGKKKYSMDAGDSIHRRSLYTFWRRIAPPTIFFDNSDRLTCSVKTMRTNTPLHALNTLNDITFVEASRNLATSILLKKLTPDQSLDELFLRVLSRPPSDKERRILLAGLERTRRQFKNQPRDAKAFVSVGATQPDSQLETVELASWSSLCLAVLNLDESLTRN